MSTDQLPPTIPATTPEPRSRPSLLVRAAACISATILVLVFATIVYWHVGGAAGDFHYRSSLPPLLIAASDTVWTLGAAGLLLTRVGMLAAPLPRWLLRVGPWLLTAFFAFFALLHVASMADGPRGDW
ncbi:MAG: hypothetical protein LC777_12165 [Actinobacteria bacterium]|nr:hypothetical protein [Actinomycetota bacterium]